MEKENRFELNRRNALKTLGAGIGLLALKVTGCTNDAENVQKIDLRDLKPKESEKFSTEFDKPSILQDSGNIIDARAEIIVSTPEEINILKLYASSFSQKIKNIYDDGIGSDNAVTNSSSEPNSQTTRVINDVEGGSYRLESTSNDGVVSNVTILISDDKDRPINYFAVNLDFVANLYTITYPPTEDNANFDLTAIAEQIDTTIELARDSVPIN